jgi:hypothetical protein
MPEIKKLCKKYRARLLYNETNPDKGYSADKMKQIGINVKQYPETQNKHVKICTYLYEYWSEITWDKDTEPEYMNQILDYMEGNEPDDAPDSAASLIREAYGSKGSSMNGWDW